MIDRRVFRIKYIFNIAILLVMLTSSSLAVPSSNWQVMVVDDPGDIGPGNSIAIDNDGYAHVSYYDNTNYAVKHAYQDAAGWHIQDIHLQKDTNNYLLETSIALDNDGFARVSFVNPSPVELLYAEQDALGWTVITVTQVSDTSPFNSLALDQDGVPHLAFCSSLDGPLQYASLIGDSWQIETVDANCSSGTQRSLALANDGTPHNSYKKEEALWYAFHDDEGWHTQMITGGGFGVTSGGGNSIALDSQGFPHIAHNVYESDTASSKLLHEYQDSQGWHRETIDDHINTSDTTSIAIDSEDNPQVSYFYMWPNNGLAHAYRSTYGWNYELIEADGSGFGSLALKDGKYPHISYLYYSSGYILKYAYLPPVFTTFIPLSAK